jgi:hypothetical protein
VLYQRDRAGSPSRKNPSDPNTCLVVAEGTNYPLLSLGLGTTHPNCYASHFGFQNNDANQGWTENTWWSYSVSSKQYVDGGINLVSTVVTAV